MISQLFTENMLTFLFILLFLTTFILAVNTIAIFRYLRYLEHRIIVLTRERVVERAFVKKDPY